MTTNALQIAKDQLDRELDEWETEATSIWQGIVDKGLESPVKIKLKGGKGSGFYGHKGREGSVGGSSSGISVDISAPNQQEFDNFVRDMELQDNDYIVNIGGTAYDVKTESWYPDCLEGRDICETSEYTVGQHYKDVMLSESGWGKADIYGHVKNVDGVEFGITYIGKKINIQQKQLTVKLKGGSGSGNFGHSGRRGMVGGSSSSAIVWNPNGKSVVMRGGEIPKSGPIFLTTSPDTAENYNDSRGVGLYQLDMKNNVLVNGSREWNAVFGDKAEEYEELGPELFSDPPRDFLWELHVAGYVGYASNDGNYIRIQGNGKHIIEQKQLPQIRVKHITEDPLKENLEAKKRPNTKKGIKVRISAIGASEDVVAVEKGGPGSGDFGHKGRPGQVGGSATSTRNSAVDNRLTISVDDAYRRSLKARQDAMDKRRDALVKATTKKTGKLRPAPANFLEGKSLYRGYKMNPNTGRHNLMRTEEEAIARANELISKATNGKVTDFQAFVHSAYEFKHEESGTYVKINTIGVDATIDGMSYDGRLYVGGKIFDANGTAIGTVQRYVQANNSEIHNDYLELTEGKGSGFGAAFYKNAEEVYQDAGIEKVTIYANIDVGGYAWARMGFDFADNVSRQNAYERLVTAFSRDQKTTFNLAIAELKNSFGITESSKAWEFAAFTSPSGAQLGKQSMLNTYWNAYKYVDPSNEGWLAGQAYYKSKGL